MRIVCVSLLTAVLFASVAWAQAIDPELQRVIDIRGAARAAGDAEEWGRPVTFDFILILPDGSVMNKMQRMAAIKAGTLRVSHNRLSDLNVRLYGDTAIRSFRDNSLGFPARFTSVWVKTGNRWLAHMYL